MPINFEAFKEDETVNKKFDKRTYFARSWREMGGNSSGDAGDLDVHDFEFQGTSFPDALGQWIAHEVQVAVGNQVVKFSEFLTDTLNDMTIKDTESYNAHLSYVGGDKYKEYVDRALNDIKNGKSNNMFPVPLGMVKDICMMIMEMMIEHNNFWFWQEPQLIMMGNPDIIKNMHVQAKSEEEVISDGISNLETYLKKKVKGEEE
tara:strand:+ start:76 stop:687 length:612 start_codon:yes stop_codon:yes gene_type:complete